MSRHAAAKQPETPTEMLRAHYSRMALERVGIPFERGIEIAGVREAIEGAIRVEWRRGGGRNAQHNWPPEAARRS